MNALMEKDMIIRAFFTKLLGTKTAKKQEEATAAVQSYARLDKARQWLDNHQSNRKVTPKFDDERTPDMLDDAHDPTKSHLPFNIFNRDN